MDLINPPAIIVTAEASLAELSQQIAASHADAVAAARTSVEHARRCGELLLRVKARLPHGQFMPWVKANCPFSQRTTNAYMRVSRDWEKLRQTLETEEPETIAEALGALTEPREPNSQPTANLPSDAEPEDRQLAAVLEHLQAAAQVCRGWLESPACIPPDAETEAQRPFHHQSDAGREHLRAALRDVREWLESPACTVQGAQEIHRLSTEILRDAAETKLRAERELGKLLNDCPWLGPLVHDPREMAAFRAAIEDRIRELQGEPPTR